MRVRTAVKSIVFSSVLMLVAVAVGSPSARAQTRLPEKDEKAVVAKAKEKYKSFGDATNAAGKKFQSASVGEYAVEEDGQVAVWATIRRNEADRVVLEFHKLAFRREGDSWAEAGDEIVHTVEDDLRPLTIPSTSTQVNDFQLQHDRMSATLKNAEAWPVFWGKQIVGMILRGKGNLKFDPPNEIEAFYLRRGVKQVDKNRPNVTSLDETVEEVQILFKPGEEDRYIGLLGLETPPSPDTWQGKSSPAPKLQFFGTGVEAFEYKNEQYSPDVLEKAPGSLLVRAKTKGLGWLLYVVKTDEAIPIQLLREEKAFFFLGGGAGQSQPNVWCGYNLPEERAGDPWAAEHREPPKDFDTRSGTAKVTIDETISPTMIVDWRVEAEAIGDIRHADFVLLADPEHKDRWTTVDALLLDGRPQMTVSVNPFVRRAYFEQPVAKGRKADLTVLYRSTALLEKIDTSFTYVQRFGWTPFLDIFTKGIPMELTVNLPDKYTAMSFGKVVEENASGGVRTVRFRSDYPVNFPTLIYGQYNIDEADVDGRPAKMHVGKTLQSIVNYNLDVGQRVPVSFPRLEVSRGKVERAFIEAQNAVRVYENLFGTKYPYPKLDLVSAPFDGASAQSPSGIIYVGNIFLLSDASINEVFRQVRTTDWKGVVAHEVAHQWWGAQVNNLNNAHYWFVESLSEISAAIYLAIAEGPKAYLEKVRSWKREALEAGEDCALQDASWRANTFPGYLGNVYNKGPYVFHMYAQLFGPEKLEEFMKNLATENEGKSITTRDVQRVAERTVNVDLEWFFDQWVRGVGIPTIRYKTDWFKNEEGKWVVRVHVEQEIRSGKDQIKGKTYNLLIPLYVKTQSGQEMKVKLALTEPVMDKAFVVPEEPFEVTLMNNEETLAYVEKLP